MAEDLLLEMGTEELPWGAVQDGRRQLEKNAAAMLQRERLGYEDINIYSTPRRLTLLVRGLKDRQDDTESVVRGPSRRAAYDGAGKPTRAAEGFAGSRGVSVEDLARVIRFIVQVNGQSTQATSSTGPAAQRARPMGF